MAREKFRETMWFKVGHETASDAEPENREDPEESGSAVPLPIEDRYRDDGTVSAEDSMTFGLHTGTTEYIKLVRDLAAESDGEASDVAVAALIGEMKHKRSKLFAIAASVIAACATFVVYAI